MNFKYLSVWNGRQLFVFTLLLFFLSPGLRCATGYTLLSSRHIVNQNNAAQYVYSGTRCNGDCVLRALPWGALFAPNVIFIILDLPLSLIADTVLLPFTGTHALYKYFVRSAERAEEDRQIEFERKVAIRWPLIAAARRGDEDRVLQALESGADVNVHDKRGRTALIVAQNVKIARLLVELGADVNASDFSGKTPLMRAVELGSWEEKSNKPDLVVELIKRGARVDARDQEGRTALIQVARNLVPGRGIPLLLLQNGANINASDADGRTPLMHAVINAARPVYSVVHLDMIDLFLENGAEVNARDSEGDTALDLANVEYLKTRLRRAGAR